MNHMKLTKTWDDKISEYEDKLRRIKERCDKASEAFYILC